MKKSFGQLLVLFTLTPFLVQCASQDEVRTLSYQLRAVNKKLEDMQANTVGDIQKKQANSSGQLTEMQQEILALKGELEATALSNRQLQEQNKELESSIQGMVSKNSSETDTKITQINEQLKQQQDSVASLHEARAKEAERKAQVAAEAAEAAKLKAKTAATPPGAAVILAEQKKLVKGKTPPPVKPETAVTQAIPAAPPAKAKPTTTASHTPPAPVPAAAAVVETASTPAPAAKKEAEPAAASDPGDEVFKQAQKKYEAGDYRNAYENYESYLDKHGTGANAVQARYMMGESLYQQKEYDQAILQYQKIISSQPKHAKTPAALLKQAMAFEQLSDKDTAKIIYQKIISSYGSSPEAAQAKSKLGSL
ncbi:MAG: tol-pal system protein YbgF [Desulfobulbaceae bacterium]|nr:tol-pal system protein YbgF [Desulfobulbaceae bacterium]